MAGSSSGEEVCLVNIETVAGGGTGGVDSKAGYRHRSSPSGFLHREGRPAAGRGETCRAALSCSSKIRLPGKHIYCGPHRTQECLCTMLQILSFQWIT